MKPHHVGKQAFLDADFNGDQLPDVAISSSAGTTVGIFLQLCK